VGGAGGATEAEVGGAGGVGGTSIVEGGAGAGAGDGGTTGTGGSDEPGGAAGAGGEGGTVVPPECGSLGTCGGPKSLGFVGCSLTNNAIEGYGALGGGRLWGQISAYGGKAVQAWASNTDAAWDAFDAQVAANGEPSAVWLMLCVSQDAITYDETKQVIANTRLHAPNAILYISGQPLYEGATCSLSGANGPALSDMMAQDAGEDATQDVIYVGTFGPLTAQQRSDGCHGNAEGRAKLGQQIIDRWGL
jgi:hypothetical protein